MQESVNLQISLVKEQLDGHQMQNLKQIENVVGKLEHYHSLITANKNGSDQADDYANVQSSLERLRGKHETLEGNLKFALKNL